MKTSAFLPLLPSLIAGFLLATPSTGFCDDHHHHHYYGRGGPRAYFYGGPYYGGPYYGDPYYGDGYGYGPSVTFGFHHESGPSYGSDDLAVDVQRELRRQGYYRGAIDGDTGPGTRAAIRAYQNDRRLPVTGRIDRPLIRSMDLD